MKEDRGTDLQVSKRVARDSERRVLDVGWERVEPAIEGRR